MSSLPPPTSTKIRHDTTRNSTRASQEDGESCHQSQSLHVPQHQTPQRGSSARPAPAASSHRRMAFRPTVSYREIPSRTTLTSFDIGELWFTSHDFDLNKAESRATVKKMRKLLRRHAAAGGNMPNQALLTSFDDDDDTTIRGLEHLRSRSVLVELQQQKLQVIDAVLGARDRGRRRDVIASISQKFSVKARVRAIQVGWQDAIDAWQGETATAGSALHILFGGHLARILKESIGRV